MVGGCVRSRFDRPGVNSVCTRHTRPPTSGAGAMHINTNGMTMGSLFKFLWIGNLAGWFCLFDLPPVMELVSITKVDLPRDRPCQRGEA